MTYSKRICEFILKGLQTLAGGRRARYRFTALNSYPEGIPDSRILSPLQGQLPDVTTVRWRRFADRRLISETAPRQAARSLRRREFCHTRNANSSSAILMG